MEHSLAHPDRYPLKSNAGTRSAAHPRTFHGEGVTIDPDTLKARIEAACRELGLDGAICARLVHAAIGTAEAGPRRGSRDPLRSEIEKARADRESLASLEAEVQRRLGTASPDKILHDLRNVLNDIALLREITR